MGSIEWRKVVSAFYGKIVRETIGGGFLIAEGRQGFITEVASILKTDVDGSCPPLDSDSPITPIPTSFVAIPSAGVRTPKAYIEYAADILNIDVNVAIEQTVP